MAIRMKLVDYVRSLSGFQKGNRCGAAVNNPLPESYKKILDAVQDGPKTVREISCMTGIKLNNISPKLNRMQKHGKIERHWFWAGDAPIDNDMLPVWRFMSAHKPKYYNDFNGVPIPFLKKLSHKKLIKRGWSAI